MSDLLQYVAVLGCPVGMGLMMWTMMRMQGSASRAGAERPAGTTVEKQAELAELRAEIDQLRAAREDHRGESKPAGRVL